MSPLEIFQLKQDNISMYSHYTFKASPCTLLHTVKQNSYAKPFCSNSTEAGGNSSFTRPYKHQSISTQGATIRLELGLGLGLGRQGARVVARGLEVGSSV